MPDKTSDVSMRGPEPLQAEATQVAGGAESISPADLVPDMTGAYDTLVDATSALIERVVTATKSY